VSLTALVLVIECNRIGLGSFHQKSDDQPILKDDTVVSISFQLNSKNDFFWAANSRYENILAAKVKPRRTKFLLIIDVDEYIVEDAFC
jgi:hypothetical protein